jgi:hypothetical protein
MWCTVIKPNQNVSTKSTDNGNLYAVASLCAAYIIVELNLALEGRSDFRGIVSHPKSNTNHPDYMREGEAGFSGNPDHGGETAWYMQHVKNHHFMLKYKVHNIIKNTVIVILIENIYLRLAQRFPDHMGIRITGVRIT